MWVHRFTTINRAKATCIREGLSFTGKQKTTTPLRRETSQAKGTCFPPTVPGMIQEDTSNPSRCTHLSWDHHLRTWKKIYSGGGYHDDAQWRQPQSNKESRGCSNFWWKRLLLWPIFGFTIASDTSFNSFYFINSCTGWP